MEIEANHALEFNLNKFITRIWEHPLLGEETIKHRQKSKDLIVSLLEEIGISQEDVIVIPVGSLIWVTDEESDFDYQLIFVDQDEKYDDHQKILFIGKLAQKKIHFIPRFPCSEKDFLADESLWVNFLFTPDEYVVGNNEKIAKLRLSLTEKMKLGRLDENDWRRIIKYRFKTYFPDWKNDDSAKGEKGDKAVHRTRMVRFLEKLLERARQTKSSANYVAAFLKNLTNFEAPPMATYIDQLEKTKGYISLQPRYAAQGIKPVELDS